MMMTKKKKAATKRTKDAMRSVIVKGKTYATKRWWMTTARVTGKMKRATRRQLPHAMQETGRSDKATLPPS